MPGIGLVIDGAVQQAPQLSRQFMVECGVKDARCEYNLAALRCRLTAATPRHTLVTLELVVGQKDGMHV